MSKVSDLIAVASLHAEALAATRITDGTLLPTLGKGFNQNPWAWLHGAGDGDSKVWFLWAARRAGASSGSDFKYVVTSHLLRKVLERQTVPLPSEWQHDAANAGKPCLERWLNRNM